MNCSRKKIFLLRCICLVLLQSTACLVRAATPLELLQELDDYPHAQVISNSDEQVIDYELGLGSIKKVRGVWRFKDSERKTGHLQTYTWQIVDGFSSEEVMQSLQASLEQQENASILFACDGRSCGQGAQWANRVFHQRVLYGREDLQRYRIYSLQGSEGTEYRLVIYSAARTADRQYLHVELLQIDQ
jgi:hypothetical protein